MTEGRKKFCFRETKKDDFLIFLFHHRGTETQTRLRPHQTQASKQRHSPHESARGLAHSRTLPRHPPCSSLRNGSHGQGWHHAVQLIPIKVQCYAGFKADETPCSFILETRTVEVEEVIDRWYQVESLPEWLRADYFKVRGKDQHEYLLKHDLESDEWFLGRRG
jgi:hypothetical protein